MDINDDDDDTAATYAPPPRLCQQDKIAAHGLNPTARSSARSRTTRCRPARMACLMSELPLYVAHIGYLPQKEQLFAKSRPLRPPRMHPHGGCTNTIAAHSLKAARRERVNKRTTGCPPAQMACWHVLAGWRVPQSERGRCCAGVPRS